METNGKNYLSSKEQPDILSALTTTEKLASNPDSIENTALITQKNQPKTFK